MTYIKIKKRWCLPEAGVTDENSFWSRRKFLQALGISSVSGMAAARGLLSEQAMPGTDTGILFNSELSTPAQNSVERHHNFVEFSQWNAETGRLSSALDTESWPVSISGLIERPMTLEAGELLSMMKVEQRVYRFRCIEGWSMVVPWTGFPLKRLLEKVKPKRNARYVRFDSFFDPQIAGGQRQDDWHVWPYREVMTMAEANNELSFLAGGVYGKNLPKAQGAPLRLILPWKYAIKSAKSVSSIVFTEQRPATFWELARPGECDLNCLVDPEDRYSKIPQQQELSINSGDWQPTQYCNGYAAEVAGLYS